MSANCLPLATLKAHARYVGLTVRMETESAIGRNMVDGRLQLGEQLAANEAVEDRPVEPEVVADPSGDARGQRRAKFGR